jgi:hypothetical protein
MGTTLNGPPQRRKDLLFDGGPLVSGAAAIVLSEAGVASRYGSSAPRRAGAGGVGGVWASSFAGDGVHALGGSLLESSLSGALVLPPRLAHGPAPFSAGSSLRRRPPALIPLPAVERRVGTRAARLAGAMELGGLFSFAPPRLRADGSTEERAAAGVGGGVGVEGGGGDGGARVGGAATTGATVTGAGRAAVPPLRLAGLQAMFGTME